MPGSTGHYEPATQPARGRFFEAQDIWGVNKIRSNWSLGRAPGIGCSPFNAAGEQSVLQKTRPVKGRRPKAQLPREPSQERGAHPGKDVSQKPRQLSTNN